MTVIYKNLGNSNLKVSNICLGTMTFGEQTNQNEANDIMDFAFENGALTLDFLRFNFGGLLVCLLVVADFVLMASPFSG